MKSKKLKGVLYAFLPIIIVFVLYFVLVGANFSSSIYTLPEKDDGYEITAYDVKINVDENGKYNVNETITANFTEKSHGIKRWLQRYQKASYVNTKGKLVSKDYRVKISNFQSAQYFDHDVRGDYVLYYLGSMSERVLGEHTYTLSYTLDTGDDRESSMDMLYFNVIGTGWDTNISNITFSIELPKAVDGDVKFYVGEYGGTAGADRVSYSFVDGTKIVGSVSYLDYGEAVTVFKALDNGYFKYSRNYFWDIAFLVAFLVSISMLVVFFVKDRRKSPIVEVVEFAPTEGLTPTDVGYLNDFEVTGDDLSALLVYWASNGYVNIIEKEDGKKKKIFIRKVSDLPAESKKHEKILFDDLFRSEEIIETDKISSYLSLDTGYKCVQSVESEHKNKIKASVDNKYDSFISVFSIFVVLFALKDIYASCLYGVTMMIRIAISIIPAFGMLLYAWTMQYRKKKSKRFVLIMSIVSAALIFAPILLLSCLAYANGDLLLSRFYIYILPIMMIFVCPRLENFTEAGREAVGRIWGLKNYIETAEKDKIEMLVKDDPSLFYKVLPYAYVLGVTEIYMNKFKDVKIVQPDWYQTSASDHFTITHIWILNDSMHNVSTNVSRTMMQNSINKITSSGGSGHSGGWSSGGGFSGGGFGGGGGGRW